MNMNKKLLLSLILGLCVSAYAKETKYSMATTTTTIVESSSETGGVGVTTTKSLNLMNPIKIHNDELIVSVEKPQHVINKVPKSTKTITSNPYDNNKVNMGENNETINGEFQLKPVSAKSINMIPELEQESKGNNVLFERIKSYYVNDKVIETQNSKSIGEFILTDLPLVNLDKNKSDNFKRALLNEFSFMNNSEKFMFGLDGFNDDIIVNHYTTEENQQKIMVNKVVVFYPNGIKFLTFISNENNTRFLMIAPSNTTFEHMKNHIDKFIQYVTK